MWTAARAATAVSPDNSGREEPAGTCGEALRRAASPLTAADWPPAAEQSCRLQPYPPSPHLHSSCAPSRALGGDAITPPHPPFHSTRLFLSNKKRKKKSKRKIITRGGPTGGKQPSTRPGKVILVMEIGLASVPSISHQRGYCYFCVHSKRGGAGWGWGGEGGA